MSPIVRKHVGIVIEVQSVVWVVVEQDLLMDSLAYLNSREPHSDVDVWTTIEVQDCLSLYDYRLGLGWVAVVQVVAVLDRQLSSSAGLPESAQTSMVYFPVSCLVGDTTVCPPQRQHHIPLVLFSIVPLFLVAEWLPPAPPSSWLPEQFYLAWPLSVCASLLLVPSWSAVADLLWLLIHHFEVERCLTH
jgi:hypothetical protein